MGLPVSIVLIAVGAILTWAVNRSPSGLNIHVVGVILMIVGGVGFLLSLLYWERFGGGYFRRTAYLEGGAPAAPAGYGRRRRVVEEEVPQAPVAPPGPPLDPPPY